MLKVATVSPNEPYREYKDVERVYSGSTEIDKILDKNGNVLFAVNKEVEGTPALAYKGKEETNLKNYRIYGNTVDGESVGDRTGNLFDEDTMVNGITDAYINSDGTIIYSQSWIVTPYIPCNSNVITLTFDISIGNYPSICLYDENKNYITGTAYRGSCTITVTTEYVAKYIRFSYTSYTDLSKIMLNAGSTALPYEPYGYKVPVTVEGKNLVTSCLVEPNVGTQFFPVVYVEVNLQPNTEYLITFTVHENGVKLYSNDLLFTSVYYSSEIQGKKTMRLKTKTGIRPDQHKNNKGWVLLRNAKQNPSDFTITDVKLQLVSDAPIYLDEPLAKSGNNADYIDYATQKRHNSDGTESSVTLPEISTLSGTNTLTVGTEVQPSNVYLKGRIKEIT